MTALPMASHQPAARSGQVDDYHGEKVADPYRWLEDTYSAETASWIAQQNEVTEDWLARVSSREEIRARLFELWDFPKFGVPFSRGRRWFQMRNSGLQNQSVLYVMERPDEKGRVLLDPNELSEDGTVAVEGFAVTEDGSRLAYSTSVGGSDWQTWHVREVDSGQDLPDLVEWSKFSVASWRKDGSGFYYGQLDRPAPGGEYLEATSPRRVAFHRLATVQKEDEVVFERPDQPEWGPTGQVSDDGRYLLVSISHGTRPAEQLHLLDLERPEEGFRPIVSDFASKALYVTNQEKTFYLLTDYGAERQRLVAVDLDNPARENWQEVIGGQDALLLGVAQGGGKFICHYLEDACSRLRVFEMDGRFSHDVDLPAVCSIVTEREGSGIEARADSSLVHFGVVSFLDSGSVYEHDLETKRTTVIWQADAKLDREAFSSEQVFVTADDGARIPLFLTRRKDLGPSGEVPTLLYGYGGFDIPLTPNYSVTWSAFVDRGGLLAVACLRGGGEYGQGWHEAGMRENKQRVFDDFADCARHLVSAGWTKANRLAINGGSNGGLLVGASITQHPELFGAAVADVGVLDMLRFHKFTIGWAWKSDYGDPDVEEEYRWVRAYSPLHNISPGRRYPPIMITTGDHYDRVVPGHSFKFAATLQHAQAEDPVASPGPVLLRVETSGGHGHGLPTAKAIARATDTLSFLEAALQMAPMR